MNDSLKQRSIGAIVLACIALIVWPVIFSDPGGPSLDRRSQIPATPDFKKYTVPEAVRPDNIEPVAVAKVEPEPIAAPEAAVSAKNDKKAVQEKPRQDERGLPESWVLQVASFTKAANAEELKLALQKKGYKAFSRPVVTKEGKATRVYIGPKLTKQAFTKDKRVIDKAFKVNSMVLRFEP